MKNVSEVIQAFQTMPVCDRLYLICQMLQRCISYELVYIKTVLLGSVNEQLSSLSQNEITSNKPEQLSSYSSVGFDESLDKLICTLSLVRYDNVQVGGVMFNLLSDRNVLLKAEEIEDMTVLNKLRLLYVLAVYHPALSFAQRRHLLDVFLRHLDELYQSRLAEQEKNEEEQLPAVIEDRPMMPSEGAYITACELKSVYKRNTDKRYPYILEVLWSDGAYSRIHRTYGDFFTFQNKLLDIFPEESGQKSKKSRVIPFLPGRKLLSGRSNRELAEKRLPDLWQYTHDLFTLPEYITRCNHVREFFRPRPSDLKEDGFTNQKVTTLSDVKNKLRNSSAVAFFSSSSPSSSPSRPHSTALTSSLTGVSGRVSHTLPAQQSPGQPDKQATPIGRRSTYPARPPQSAFTPVIGEHSDGKLHSNSQTSITSSNELLSTPPTTAACHVVTPPNSRLNGSPAFSLSHLSSHSDSSSPVTNNKTPHSPSIIKLVRATKLKKESKSLDVLSSACKQEEVGIKKKSSDTSLVISGFDIPVSSCSTWADRSSSPPRVDLSVSPFPVSTNSTTSAVVMTTASSTSNVLSSHTLAPPTLKSSVPFSPSLPQLYPYATPPHYPCSYTPTNFDSQSPKPIVGAVSGARWAGTPATPTSEPEHFKKWLKCHRLHKYENLFQNMTFDEVSKLTVEKMKELGMTQGAAKKLNQKMSELLNTGITSFLELPLTNISRRPSTTSLPAALLLERQLTPSSSIDQLSVHGSTCSLDILGNTFNAMPTHRHSDSLTDTMIVDKAILEAGPPTLINGGGGANRKSDIESNDSPSKVGVANGRQPYWTTPTDKPDDTRTSYTPTHLPYMEAQQPRIQPALLPSRTGGVVTSNWTHPLGGSMVIGPPMLRPLLAYTPINGLVRGNVTPPQRYPCTSSSSVHVHGRSCYKCGNRGHQGSHCPLVDHSAGGGGGILR